MFKKIDQTKLFDLENEFSNDVNAILRNYFIDMKKKGKINLLKLQESVILWILASNLSLTISQDMTHCSIFLVDGQKVHLKTTGNKTSIGKMYCFIEDLKSEGKFPIKDYTCKESTLDTIFEKFASEDNVVDGFN